VLGSLDKALTSTLLAGGASPQLLQEVNLLMKMFEQVYGSNKLPTLGASIIPTENAGAQGSASSGAPYQQQQGGVGLFDNHGRSMTQTDNHGRPLDPNHHG
jgi:hypothetical protein